ncbi:Flp pilus assembly protein CpaB [Intrasporangium calvum]|uniref:Flp pilus assembly protein CpaB n=1 Tax=Intrasporangium calvum (strain ATCC 23552 / DSM 43043 / JCM 3097 / NBRC 12989 / NCIMB 10167 / NRRL B-3866 / 7 KIP) TaxID=710696 RepID=E6S8S9_INTC7|nr:RcpC/CpaB family pilus assembly protein [Intrasporangium calvum]ADU47048.1 Flp pilus assembly protein CpaB [Intrasporangium calvum DSM 43043]
MNRRLVAVLLAVLLAIAGALLVVNYVRGADARAIADQQPAKVYLAEKLIPAGTTLKDAQRTELIVETRVATVARPQGALDDINPENSALLALSDIQPGEFVMASRFGTRPVGEKAIEVPAGMLAMSVELSDPARIGKFVTPGSDIAIFATHGMKLIGEDDATKAFNELNLKGTTVLLDKVQVIAMGDTPLAAPKKAEAGKADEQTPSFLVTVAVTPEQSLRLAHGINEYTLYAGLRGSDVKIPADGHTDDSDIFSYDMRQLLKQVRR